METVYRSVNLISLTPDIVVTISITVEQIKPSTFISLNIFDQPFNFWFNLWILMDN